MIKRLLKYYPVLFFWIILSGCIHDYPDGRGVDPSKMNAEIELTCSLHWDDMWYKVQNLNSRARAERNHRFIIEVMRNGEIVCRDTSFLSDDEMAATYVRHKLSKPLGAMEYQVAVWYDLTHEMYENARFNAVDFSSVSLISSSAVRDDSIKCGYAAGNLDLTSYRGKLGVTAVKEIELKHPGAKFEIIASDIQDFITNQRDDLLQGDNFIVKLEFEENSPSSFNLYSGKPEYSLQLPERSGELVLPFGNYEELEIAAGFLFCNDEDNITMTLTVYNSALVAVTKTDKFSFPIRRGYITKVIGDFLTHPIDSPVTVDHIWEGEIFINI